MTTDNIEKIHVALLDDLSEGVVACDNNGKIVIFNCALKKILDLPNLFLTFDGWTKHFTLYDEKEKFALVEEKLPLYCALNGETIHQKKFILMLQGQKTRNIIIDAKPLFDDAGNTLGAAAIFYDVTEQTQIDHHLIQSEKMSLIGRLAPLIAHELNQPLSIIRTNLQTLTLLSQDGLTKSDILELVSSSIAQIDRAGEIINCMRKSSTKMHKPTNAINIVEPIETAVLKFEKSFDMSNINIIRDYADELPKIHIEPYQLEQVVTNLLSNAKYAIEEMKNKRTDDLIMSIKLSLMHDKGSQKLIFDFLDNGIGMNDDVLKYCLKPFYTGRQLGDNPGLGLTLVNNIIKDLNGQLEITSQPNQGTKVHITLPVENHSVD